MLSSYNSNPNHQLFHFDAFDVVRLGIVVFYLLKFHFLKQVQSSTVDFWHLLDEYSHYFKECFLLFSLLVKFEFLPFVFPSFQLSVTFFSKLFFPIYSTLSQDSLLYQLVLFKLKHSQISKMLLQLICGDFNVYCTFLLL